MPRFQNFGNFLANNACIMDFEKMRGLEVSEASGFKPVQLVKQLNDLTNEEADVLWKALELDLPKMDISEVQVKG